MRPLLTSLPLLTTNPRPTSWWRAENLVPAIQLPEPSLFHDGTDLEGAARQIAAHAPPGWLWASWCYAPDLPGPLTALPEPGWQVFLPSVKRLGTVLHAHLGGGLIVDAEYYPATPDGSGGPMQAGTWKQQGAEVRGAALARALGPGLTLAFMNWAPELRRQPGLAAFVRGAWKAAGPAESVFLSEDYMGAADPKTARALGAGTVRSGVWIKRKGQRVPENAGWVYDPEGWVFK